MSLNPTSTWLEARQAPMVLPFSKHLGTSSGWLTGAGGLAGDGFPMPCAGILRSVLVFDGISVKSDDGEVAFNAGDRIALYGTYDGVSTFTVAATINASPTSLAAVSVASGVDVYAIVELLLLEDA